MIVEGQDRLRRLQKAKKWQKVKKLISAMSKDISSWMHIENIVEDGVHYLKLLKN